MNNLHKEQDYELKNRNIELDIYSFLNTLSRYNQQYLLCYITRSFLFRFRFISNINFTYNGFCHSNSRYYEVRSLNNELVLKFHQEFNIDQYKTILSNLYDNLFVFTITPSSLSNHHIDVLILPNLPDIDQITHIPLLTFLSKKYIIRQNKRIQLLKHNSYCEYKQIRNIIMITQQIDKNDNTYIRVTIVFSYSL